MKKFLIKIGCLSFSILLIGMLLLNYSYYFSQPSSLKLCMDMMYDDSTNYDMALVGPSTVYSGYSTEVLDEKLGTNSIILSTEGMLSCDAYILIEEFLKNNQAKYVVLDVEPDYYMGKDLYNSTESNTTRMVLGTVKPSISKICFQLAMIVKRPKVLGDFLVCDFNPIRLFPGQYEKYINWNTVKEMYSHYILGKKGERYTEGSGSYEDLEDFKLERDMNIRMKIAFDYTEKIAEVCKKNDAKLLLVTSSPSDAYVNAYPDYKKFHDIMEEFATGMDVEYWDFAYASPKLWKRNVDNWSDAVHLSRQGAYEFSEALAKIMYMWEDEENFENLFDES